MQEDHILPNTSEAISSTEKGVQTRMKCRSKHEQMSGYFLGWIDRLSDGGSAKTLDII